MEGGRRLHWSSMVTHLQRLITSTFIIWIGLASQFRDIEQTWIPIAAATVGLSLIAGLIIVRWRRFRYFLLDDEIVAIDGGLVKTEIRIPYDKIQTVDGNASLVSRVFGVSRLQIKTASKGTQIDLTAVSNDEAARVRAVIAERRGHVVTPEEEAQPTLQRTLSTTEIIVAAATSRQFLVSLGVVSYLYSELSEALAFNLFTEAFKAAKTDDGFDPWLLDPILVVGVIGIFLVSWIGTILYTVLVFKSYGIGRDRDTLTIRRGLTNIRNIEVPVFRIQSVEIKQTPLQVLLGYGELQIRVIGHAEEKQQNTVLHPCLSRDEWQPFLDQFLPGFKISDTTVRAPARALARFIVRGIRKPLLVGLPLAIFIGVGVDAWGAAVIGLLMLPFLFVGVVIGVINFRVESIGYSDTHATFILQDWTRVIGIVRRDAFQQYIVKQNWFQRRLDVVTFGVEVASGAVGVKHFVHDLDESESNRFAGWLGDRPTALESGASSL